MLGGVTRHMLPHLPGVPHLHVNRPLVTRAPEIFYSWFASTCQGVHIVDNTINNFLKSLRENSFSFPDARRDVTCKLAIRC